MPMWGEVVLVCTITSAVILVGGMAIGGGFSRPPKRVNYEPPVPAEDVVPEEKDPLEGVSEPIITIGKAIEESPKRFKVFVLGREVEEIEEEDRRVTSSKYTIIDNVTKCKVEYWSKETVYTRSSCRSHHGVITNHAWITPKEISYLRTVLENSRTIRMNHIQNKKLQRSRKKVADLYNVTLAKPVKVKVNREDQGEVEL